MNKQTMSSKSSLGFELLDIEIIDHKKESGISNQKWNCDQCSLFFLSEDKLKEHKNKHAVIEGYLKCRYCNKTLSITEENKECYTNRKCNTCEYKCLTCPMRFQRYSSLVNHENSHLIKKKRMSTGTSKKKKQVEEIESSKQVIEELRTTTTKRKDSIDDQIFATVSPKKRKTIPVKHLDTKPVLSDTKNTVQTKDKTKRLSNSNKTHQETPRSEMKKMTKASTSTNYTNTSSNEVNYKPFSCHICSDNFASPESVLEHIKEFHGENESKGFKCKYCNDEFDDIYKMQFHLAICPLADDQPSTTLVKNIASKFHATPSTSGLQRKKGRPRKIKSENAEDQTDFNQTLPSSNRKSAKKRGKSEETSDSTETPKGSKRPRRNRKETKANIDYEDEFEYCNPDYLDKDDAEISNKEHDSKKDPLSDSFEKTPDEKEKGHTCPFPRCGIKFSREKALLSHMRNHTDDFEDVYKCHKCDIPFDDIHSLRAHLNECKCVEEENEEDESEPEYKGIQKSSKKKSRGNYTCNICGRVYQSQENLKRCLHNIEDQSEISPSCRLCGEICDEDQTLRKHFRTSHPQSLPFCCSVCNAEFDSKAAEKEHFSSHLNSEDFMCIICSLNLPTYKDLYFHYKQDHVTNQQNICNICNKMFPNKAQLKMHRCDLAEQRTKCIFCHKVCSSGAALNIHIKRHTNKKIFKCKVCYRSFFDTGDLMKHMLFHATAITGERPLLRCCLCFVTYRHLPILKNHIRKTHFYKELNCPICGVELMDDQVVASHLIRHSVRISKGTMSKVEVQWAEQNKAKSIESATASRKGRPRKYFNSSNTATSTTSLLQSQDSNHTQMTSNKNETSKITNEGITNGDQYSRAIDDDSSTVNIQTNKKTGRKSTMPRISKVAKQDGPNNTSSEKKGTKQSSIILWKKHQIEAEGIIQNNSTTKQRPITNQIETEGINKNNSTKKQRPMFFMKVTSSGKKSNKPRKCNNDNLTVKKNTQTSTSNKRISTYDHDSNDFTCLNNTGDKHIKDERLSPVDNSNLSVDENFVDSIKHEQDFYPAKVKEESESCIKEMKYYEPSLDLTEYCCTTCHLSFSSHNELLVHTTLHIL